jgi:pimeloyl-ACP methyl ester carboxylesterase
VISATPARQGSIELSDGRRLTYAEFGDLDGHPMVLLHGNPGSRLVCPDADATRDAGVRLLTFDRPGFGGSDPRPFHRLVDVADDLAELAVALGLDTVPVLGWSGGGPFALAAAVRHPDLVRSVAVVSGSGLPDDPDLLAQRSDEAHRLIDELRTGSVDAFAAVEERFAFYAEDPTSIVTTTLSNEADPDRHHMGRAPIRDALTTMWQEGARQGAAGLAAGWVALWALPWGFTPSELELPLTHWHGADDVVVPLPQAERLADTLAGVAQHRFVGEGHLIALDHWHEILDAHL